MLTIPVTLTRLMVKFAPVFSKHVREQVQVLVVGALLAPGKRAVTAVLQVMGVSQERHFQNDHRVLNRHDGRASPRLMYCWEMVVRTLPVVLLDDTIYCRLLKGTGRQEEQSPEVVRP